MFWIHFQSRLWKGEKEEGTEEVGRILLPPSYLYRALLKPPPPGRRWWRYHSQYRSLHAIPRATARAWARGRAHWPFPGSPAACPPTAPTTWSLVSKTSSSSNSGNTASHRGTFPRIRRSWRSVRGCWFASSACATTGVRWRSRGIAASVTCPIHRAMRFTGKITFQCTRSTGGSSGSMRRTCACLPSSFWTTRRCTTTRDPFLFYIMTVEDDRGDHLVGYFSKVCPKSPHQTPILFSFLIFLDFIPWIKFFLFLKKISRWTIKNQAMFSIKIPPFFLRSNWIFF